MRSHMRLISAAMSVATVVGFLCLPAEVSAQFGDVDVFGNVVLSDDATLPNYTFYYDDPSTPGDEGSIPESGNRIDPFVPAGSQVEYEGRIDGAGNRNFDIIVGRNASGQLLLNSATLNDQNLIIGDQGLVGPNLRRGTGTMRIEGFGALYNNDPTILPYPLTVSPSQTPRVTTEGFDMWVGRFGTGVLNMLNGGQAQIQDAVLVGDQTNSIGTITIDGFDSFLQSGGFFSPGAADPDEVNYMIIGRLGSGTMRLINGGQSYNAGPITSTSGGQEQWGAVIGSNFAADNAAAPAKGGNGLVEVDGVMSKWTVGGNLQVGGFHNNRIGIGPTAEEDLEGELAEYGTGVGSGTLRVTNGGLVSIIPPPLNETASNAPNRLDFLVGKVGRVELLDGRIELLGAFDSSNPDNPTQEIPRGRLINDGFVGGDGSISVLQFRNRVRGEVSVAAGQSLIIAATGDYSQPDNIPLPTEPEEYPLSNYGLIKVQGTPEALAEIEFQRNLVTIPTPTDFTRPLLNLPIPVPPGAPNGRTGGEIVASNSNMKFESNLVNRHKITFNGGSNLVTGNVFNEPGGTVFIGGDQTTVTFIDEFQNLGGTLSIQPNISLVMFLDNLTLGGAGSLSTTFGGRPTGQQISMLSSAEDIFLGGTLNASLFTAPGVPSFSPQAGDQFAIINSATALVDDFDTVNLPDCIGGTLCFFGFKDDTLHSYFVRVFDLLAAVGGDLDGSGLVDDLDFEVWRQNLGNTAGPGVPLAGDANNDGIVDGDDFLIWLVQFGTPGMAVPGAGSGSLTPVPEPASIALVAAGSMLALAFARRRAA